MSIPGSSSPFLLAQQPSPYTIERSVRFNSSDSGYCSRTPAASGNRKTWTWAGWVKRSGFGAIQALFGNSNGAATNGHALIIFTATEELSFQATDDNVTNSYILTTSQVFRDFSSWCHVVCALDTTEVTPSDRASIYINGVKISALSTATYPSQNYDGYVNRATPTSIGAHLYTGGLGLLAFDGYLADVHFIDGQALDPTSFGEFDDNGIWQPIEYTGSFGTNGFHLPFDDNSTAAALGTDTSGNSNTWTVNNISVAAGAGNDSLVDVPTNGTETDTGLGGEVRGNYCTLSPIDSTSGITLSNGNLQVSQTAGATVSTNGSFGIASGKWYWEVQCTSGGNSMVGIADLGVALDLRQYNDAGGLYYYQSTGGLYGYLGGSFANTSYGSSFPLTSDIVGVALDMDNGDVTFYKNGVSQGVANTSTLLGKVIAPSLGNGGATAENVINFGQRPFAYTAPSGFKALCTANLPAPVVTKPSEYMDVALYTGNGSTQTISGLDFSPDLVWIKNRAAADSHKLTDTVRGATEELESDTTAAEATNADGLTAFNSDGFDLGADAEYNTNTETYVAWCWDAGTTTASNPDGSITSQVRANPSAGFSIVAWTGDGAAANIGHGLGAEPHLIIHKFRTATSNWSVYTKTTGTGGRLLLNGTAGFSSDGAFPTAPTSSIFYVNSGLNDNGVDIISYCFAPVDGYTVASSYTGNGNADGPFVFTNMRPRWILIKRTDTTSNWTIIDTAREGYNVDNDPLFPNLSNAEGTTDLADILSNGFKLRTTDASVNANTGTYIYFAIAEAAFNYSRAR